MRRIPEELPYKIKIAGIMEQSNSVTFFVTLSRRSHDTLEANKK